MDNNRKTISVIIPVYNTEKYIDKTIQSLIWQTFQEFEVILVDDETTDNAILVADNMLKNYNLSYNVIHQKNQGLGESRNNGVKQAVGEWLIFLDSDDVLQPDTFELMMNIIRKDKNIDFIFSDYQIVFPGEEFKKAKYNNGLVYYDKQTIQDSFLLRKQIILAPGTLIKKSWYLENDLQFKKIPYSEDQLFIWEMLLKTNRSVKIQKPLYNYLARPGSIMSSTKLHAIIEGYSEFERMQEKYLNCADASILAKRYLLPRWVIGILHSGAKLVDKYEFKVLYMSLKAKKNCLTMLKFPSIKFRLIASFILLFPRISYQVLRRF